MSEEGTSNLRRSSRRVSPKCYRTPTIDDYSKRKESSESSAESEFEGVAAERPALLFNEDEDIEGQQIFAFRTPKKRNALANVAESAKTPKVVRQKLKKGKFPSISL